MDVLRRIDLADIFNRPLFTFCASALTLLYLLNFVVQDSTERFGLVTANTLITNTYVWNLVTSCFYERYILKYVIDLVCLLLITKALPIPSIEQFGLYFLFSILGCTIISSVYCFVAFFALGKEEMLITPVYGFSGAFMSILMYARQMFRGESVHPALPRLTYHHLPVLLVTVQVLLRLLFLEFMVADLPFSAVALFFCWGYLRFYYKHSDASAELGDRAEDFSFVSMFPEALHLILVPFTTAFYNLSALLGVFPPLDPVEKKSAYHHLRGNQSNSPSAAEAGAAGFVQAPKTAENVIAERQRAKALKLLDAKMAELSQEPEGWDEVGMPDVDMPIPSIASAAELGKYKV
ncbi:hypothetical protein B484DRAFT_453929 [Ochromonadaceae sp. CCMP2298]|nr:hypothetical protein B484DRAFT_453929 [Ochromonadaceae sp. CCMP2298]|mmetsp:Transcript_20350/g.45269  ORF Transcript_20350/g.45269 Transcript_20350/m.45269 type:complete len:350 (-) Transcript_20350:111-1160(-)